MHAPWILLNLPHAPHRGAYSALPSALLETSCPTHLSLIDSWASMCSPCIVHRCAPMYLDAPPSPSHSLPHAPMHLHASPMSYLLPHPAPYWEHDMIACSRHPVTKSPKVSICSPSIAMRDSSNGHVGLSMFYWVMYMHAHITELPESAHAPPFIQETHGGLILPLHQ